MADTAQALALPEPRLMVGSEGNLDYLQIAQRGKMGLGIKLMGLKDRYIAGDSVATLFVRLRCAAVEPPESSEPAVINLADVSLETWTAFPSFIWENRSSKRSSLVASMPCEGSKKETTALIAYIESGSMAEALVTFLTNNIPAEQMLYTKEQLHAVLQAQFTSWADGMKTKQVAEQAVAGTLKKGVFSTTAEALKAIYEQTGDPGAKAQLQEMGVLPPDDAEDSDSGADEGEEDDEDNDD